MEVNILDKFSPVLFDSTIIDIPLNRIQITNHTISLTFNGNISDVKFEKPLILNKVGDLTLKDLDFKELKIISLTPSSITFSL